MIVTCPSKGAWTEDVSPPWNHSDEVLRRPIDACRNRAGSVSRIIKEPGHNGQTKCEIGRDIGGIELMMVTNAVASSHMFDAVPTAPAIGVVTVRRALPHQQESSYERDGGDTPE